MNKGVETLLEPDRIIEMKKAQEEERGGESWMTKRECVLNIGLQVDVQFFLLPLQTTDLNFFCISL